MRHVLLVLTALTLSCTPSFAGMKSPRDLNTLAVTMAKGTPSGSTVSKRLQKGKKFVASKRVHSVKKPGRKALASNKATRKSTTVSVSKGHSSSRAIQEARKYLGKKPKGMMPQFWCAQFMNFIEKKLGRPGTGSNLAKSYASSKHYKRIPTPRPGDIAVLSRKGGGHVGYFVRWAENGKAVLISGNSRGGKVAEGGYSPKRVIAWVRPV